MDFKERIKNQRSCLQPTVTVVTLPNGQVIEETQIISGQSTGVVVGSAVGYVIDNKPDLEVAPILPGLCMGSQDVLSVPDLLNSCNITHVLSLGVIPVQLGSNVKHLYLPLLDLPEADVSGVLEKSFEFIDKARVEKGNVFVHCNAGVSRSATVVIGYLMKEGLSFENAYNIVKLSRPVIKPNEGFTHYLKEMDGREWFKG